MSVSSNTFIYPSDGNITISEAQIVATLSCMCKVVVVSEAITTTPCNRGIAIPVICFGISMNNTRVRRVGGETWFRRPLGEMTSDGIWVHAPTTERSMSELLRTEKIFHRESSSRCLENTSGV